MNEYHGMSNTRIWRIWKKMRERCYNKNHKYYCYYGNAGITVCDEWKDNFPNFMEWAMSNGYESHLTLDRKDNEKGYSPDNCRFVTRRAQTLNRRSNTHYELNGVTKTLSEWLDETGLKQSTVLNRLERGWSIEKALTTPTVEKYSPSFPVLHEAFGERLTMTELAKKYGHPKKG